MKNLKYFVILSFISVCLNCRSPETRSPDVLLKNYAANRARDLADVFNIGLEKEIYGTRVFLLFPIGFQDAVNGEGYGMVFGNLGKYKTGDPDYPITWLNVHPFTSDMENDETFFGKNDLLYSTFYYSNDSALSAKRGKKLYSYFDSSSSLWKRTNVAYRSDHLKKVGYRYHYFKIPETPMLFLNFDFSIGYKYGFRFGINFDELFDFLFGIVGIDFKEDDIGWQEEEN